MVFLFQVRPEAELLGGRTFSEYIAVKYRSQVVAGVNYFISVSNTYIQCNSVIYMFICLEGISTSPPSPLPL